MTFFCSISFYFAQKPESSKAKRNQVKKECYVILRIFEIDIHFLLFLTPVHATDIVSLYKRNCMMCK